MNRIKLMVCGDHALQLDRNCQPTDQHGKKSGQTNNDDQHERTQRPLLQFKQDLHSFEQADFPFLALHHQVYVAKHIAEQKADNCGEGENQHPVKRVGIGPGQNKPATRANRFVTTGQKANGYKQITFMADDPGI